jgi:hypothetical protein
MTSAGHWPIPIMTVGPSHGGTVLFRKEGKLNVTCVVKCTLKFIPDKPMQVVDAIDLFRTEVHYRDNPTRSIRATSDVVPYLPRVDVVLTGHACAPQGRHVKRQVVGLSVYHNAALLEKKLEVIGDRHGSDFIPFERMPLVYEKAYGGLGDLHNPWGTGAAAESAPPNIVYSTDTRVMAGFGPISRALRQRKALRGSMSISALEENCLELPDDFDWNYFQAAPVDQQIASLVGNEWIVLEGMHPQIPRIASRLPTVNPIIAVFGIDPAKLDATRAIPARIDMLRIDADELLCSVVARAVIPIENERSVSTMRIAAAMETEGQSYMHLLTPPTGMAGSLNTTINLHSQEKPKDGEQGTLILGDAPVVKKALPFSESKSFEIDDQSTISMDIESQHGESKRPATPFSGLAGNAPLAPPTAPIPGAPWSPVRAPTSQPIPVRARVAEQTRTDFTMVPLDEPTRRFVKPEESVLQEPPKPPPRPPASEPEASPPPKAPIVVHTTSSSSTESPAAPKPLAEPSKDMWAKTGHELPIVTEKSAPSAPRMPAKPAVNKAIYGAFGPPKKKP